jgi:hypothetical protein
MKPSRRPSQFPLRALLIMVAVCAVLCSIGIPLVRELIFGIDDGYALWGAADDIFGENQSRKQRNAPDVKQSKNCLAH